MDQTVCGDGSESVQGRVRMGVKFAGSGGDGTKKLHPVHTPTSHPLDDLSWTVTNSARRHSNI